MRKFLVGLGLAASLALTSGCSYEPFVGEVTDKEITTSQTMIYPCGNPGNCVPIYTPTTHHNLAVRATDGSGTTDVWSVKRSVYNSCTVGDGVARTEEGTVTCSPR